MPKIIFVCLLITTFWSCKNAPKSNTLEALLKNEDNKLGLTVDKDINFDSLLNNLMSLRDKEKLLEIIHKPDLEWHEASWSLYSLGNLYIKEDSFDLDVSIFTDISENYYNPLAAVKLARLYVMDKETLSKQINGVDHFERDYGKAYYYLELGGGHIEPLMEAIGKQRAQIVIDYVVQNAIGLINLFGRSSLKNKFDKKAVEQKLEKKKREMANFIKTIYIAD